MLVPVKINLPCVIFMNYHALWQHSAW